MDCKADVSNGNADNGTGQADGYPSNGASGPYAAIFDTNIDFDDSYILYSSNWLNWHWRDQVPIDPGRASKSPGMS